MEISGILNQIDQRQFVLPEFQRGYVWSREQVRGLFTSLYRRYPVGGFLVWTTQPDSEAVRGGTAQPGSAATLLLDGQQRATSLYGVMRGRPPEFFQGDERAFTGLYFNVDTEVFEFYGPVKMRDKPLWVSVTGLFREGTKSVLAQLEECTDDPYARLDYMQRLTELHSIGSIDLHIAQVPGEDRTIDEVVDIFNRVNSGGTKLSSADLALARLCGAAPQTRQELRRLLDGWAQEGFDFKLEWLLRCVTAAATGQASFDGLRDVSASEFSTALKKASQSIDFVLNLLGARLGIDHDRVLAGKTAFATLSRLVADSGGKVTDIAEQHKILYWYIHSFLWGRYSASAETNLRRDLVAAEQGGIDGLIDELERSRGSLELRPDDFDWWSVGARFYPLLYIMTRLGRAQDLVNGLPLSHSLHGHLNNLHKHHIFPKRRLYDEGMTQPQVNALANFCFLTAGSNWAISDDDPASYLRQIEQENPGVLASQWIPQDQALWQIGRYSEFLAARRALLSAAANEMLAALREGRHPAPAEQPGAQPPARPAPDGRPAGPADYGEGDDSVVAVVCQLADQLGIAAPEPHFEISDAETGDVLAIADVAWPQGIQPGRTEPVAFLLEPDPATQAHLGELGYRYFTDTQKLIWHLEELLGIDIDGDQVVGEAEPPPVI